MTTVTVLNLLRGMATYKSQLFTPPELEAINRAVKHFQRLINRQKGGA